MTAGPIRTKNGVSLYLIKMPNCLDISNRVAVVIGATSGIGKALAFGLAEHGALVIPTGRREDRLEEVCREIEAKGGRTFCQATNVKVRSSIDAFRDAVLQRFERVEILVNAAGYTMKQPATNITEEEWSGLLNTNLTGVLRSCQA